MAIPKKFKNLVTHFKLRSSQHSPQKQKNYKIKEVSKNSIEENLKQK